jgi:hypothetical protein
MAGLKISELQQPSLTADRNVSLQDIIPIARTVGAALSTFSLPGAAFFTNLASVGVGSTLVGTKTFNTNSGNYYNIKSLSAVAPLLLNDNGSTLSIAVSSSVLNNLAGLTPIKTSFIAGSNPPAVGATYFNLPNVTLPTDATAYRVDINGVLQEPNVDYTIRTNTTPFQIQFSTAPATGEKVVILAFAPGVNSLSANTILEANSVFANPTNVSFAATSVTVAQNQVLCNTSSNNLAGLSIGTNQFLGNTGTGLSAITLSANGGLTLNTSVANRATIDGSAINNSIKSLSAGFENSLSSNGYQKLPSGLILQWGTTSTYTTQAAPSATFPTPFTTSCFNVQATWKLVNAGASTASDTWVQTIKYNTNQVHFQIQNANVDPFSAGSITWFAIGY